MSNLNLVEQWHDDINQVETTEKIFGGPTGNANMATRQLAENILWLKTHMQAYKVGDIYTTTIEHADADAVSRHHGYGTWMRYAEGRALVGFSTNSDDPSEYKEMGNEFGENKHQLLISEMPKHNHSLRAAADGGGSSGGAYYGTGDSGLGADENIGTKGGDQPHNNIQPSKVIGAWFRSA